MTGFYLWACSGIAGLVQHFRAPGNKGKTEGAVSTLRAAFMPCQMLENAPFSGGRGAAMAHHSPSQQG